MRERLQRALPALVGLALFIAALEVLRHQLRAVSWHMLSADIVSIPSTRLGAAIALTVLNYFALTGYDFIALASVGKKLAVRQVFSTSFIAYAFANNVGFAALSGASVRYRFYSRFGITLQDLSRIVFAYSVSFWLGLLTLGGLSLAISPLPAIKALPAAGLVVPVGWLLAAVAPSYLALTVIRRSPVRVRSFDFMLPSTKLAVSQLLISSADWALAAGVLFVLLPAGSVPFTKLLGAFLAAQLLGLASHVPGGLGVFEGTMVLMLRPFVDSGQLLPPLVVFRVIYYLLPFCVAIVGLVSDELHQRRHQAAQVGAAISRLSLQFTPQVLAVMTFIGGLVLLFSGATPAAAGRLAFLGRFLPLGVLETSHFLGSLAGAALILLSQGLGRRLDSAYWMTVTGVSAGIVTSLLKGADYEEAAFLLALLFLLSKARQAFDRKSAFFETRFSPSWIAAVIAAITASIWIGLFAFKHVEFSTDLWWQFELHSEASRFLRASVGISVAALIFATARLLGYMPHEAPEPTADELESAKAIVEQYRDPSVNLVYLRDKTLLFDEKRTGFVMYGVHGRTWVALGDPVCPPERVPEFIRIFLDRCEDFGGTPVFYEVRKEQLHCYADFGLTFIKLGEEARVDLQGFSLEGSQGSRFRQAVRKLEKEKVRFRVLSREEAAPRMAELKTVSDDWLEGKTAEKGFSLGFFSPDYLSRFPIAVIESDGRILAFANIWEGSGKQELSLDLMRYHRDAPKGVMESLFVSLMVWGKEQGYKYFSLGMAPMSGFEKSPIAPLWIKLGLFIYEHGDSFYNFQGLRAFKEKFNPVWEPRYLASPGGLKRPRILADIAALIAGGYRRVLLK